MLRNIGIGSKLQNKVTVSGNVIIGEYTTISGPNTFIYSRINAIKIGNYCSIAPGVYIQEFYHDYNRPSSYYIYRNIFNENIQNDIYSKGQITIEDDVWIGANTIILSGITIGRGAVIGAGSVITKDIPQYTIAAGNPCRIIKQRFDQETKDFLEQSNWWSGTKIKFGVIEISLVLKIMILQVIISFDNH